MKKLTNVLRQILAVTLIFGFATLSLTGCDDLFGKDEPETNNPTAITFISVTANGSSLETTTELTLSFSAPISGLSASDITLSGVGIVNKGTLTGSNPYTLSVSGLSAGGNLSVEVVKTGFAISGAPKTAVIYYVATTLPDKVIADRYLANTYTGNDNDRIKYSYTYDGYDFYYIYLGQMSSIPLYSFEPQTHSAYNFDYTVAMSEEKKTLVQKTVSESSSTAVKTVQENTTSSKDTYDITVELNAKFSYYYVSAEVKTKFEYKREDFVQNTITNSKEYTTSLTDTVMNGTEYATRESFTRTFKWDAGDSGFPQGYYRYTMFGVSDVYLYVIRDPLINQIVGYDFLENVIPGQYSWDLEYTEKLPFEKKDASGFKFEVEFLDDLPATKQHYNEFVITKTEEWNRALDNIKKGGGGTVADPKDYTITVNGNVAVTGSMENSFGNVSNVFVTLNGTGKLYLSSQGSLLNIGGGQTVCIDSALLTLQGLKSGQNAALLNNNSAIISVNSTGKLELKYGIISDNITTTNTGGVYINGGTFTMNDGKISDNTSNANGGGVYVDNGTFTMNGGEISGNNAIRGGGVEITNKSTFTMIGGNINNNTASNIGGGAEVVSNSAFIMAGGTISNNEAFLNSGGIEIGGESTFIMNGGSISDNTASNNGGGVLVFTGSYFTMNGGSTIDNKATNGGGVMIFPDCTFAMTMGTISGNTATLIGGGVYVYGYAKFIMTGGTISKNTASEYGGGVNVIFNGSFTKTGGTITGYLSDEVNGNKVLNFWKERGHAVNGTNKSTASLRNWRDITAGPFNNLDTSIDGLEGGWDGSGN